MFAEFAKTRYPDDHQLFIEAKEFANMTNIRKMYPHARKMQRKIVFHAGSTNSGKTHEALQQLKQVSNGAYCAPLRLLAQEVYVKLNKDGVKCTLMTGQEVKEVPLATHVSCTIEMLNLATMYDCIVIDEIQMIGDEQRGKSWTRALMGACAAEIHLCGDPYVDI